mmetsp:Transcript_34440/g.87669  ORF Transcript_34440/g.87669 Transcript_34440/m.87669 type:complete len:352 (-) Transcript_34440:19-1074(-)
MGGIIGIDSVALPCNLDQRHMNHIPLFRPESFALTRRSGYGDRSATNLGRHLFELCDQLPAHAELHQIRGCRCEEHLEHRPRGHGTAGRIMRRTKPSVEEPPEHCPCDHMRWNVETGIATVGSKTLSESVDGWHHHARPQATRGHVDARSQGFVFEHAILSRSAERYRCCRLVGGTDRHLDQFFQTRREGFHDKLLHGIPHGKVRLAADPEAWLVSGEALRGQEHAWFACVIPPLLTLDPNSPGRLQDASEKNRIVAPVLRDGVLQGQVVVDDSSTLRYERERSRREPEGLRNLAHNFPTCSAAHIDICDLCDWVASDAGNANRAQEGHGTCWKMASAPQPTQDFNQKRAA